MEQKRCLKFPSSHLCSPINRCFYIQQHLGRQSEHSHSSLLMLSSLQSWTHGHLLNFLGAKHSYWSYKQGIYDEQEIAVVELCGEFVRAYAVELLHDLSGNKTRRYKVAHCSTCPNIRGTDKTKLSMHQNTSYHKLQGKTNQRKHRIIQQFLPLLNQKTTHRNIYKYAILTWCVGCKSFESEPLWCEEK